MKNINDFELCADTHSSRQRRDGLQVRNVLKLNSVTVYFVADIAVGVFVRGRLRCRHFVEGKIESSVYIVRYGGHEDNFAPKYTTAADNHK